MVDISLQTVAKNLEDHWLSQHEHLAGNIREYEAIIKAIQDPDFVKLIEDKWRLREKHDKIFDDIKAVYLVKHKATKHVKDLMRAKGHTPKAKLAYEVASRLWSTALRTSRESGDLGVIELEIKEHNDKIEQSLKAHGVGFMIYRWEHYHLTPKYWQKGIDRDNSKLEKLGSKEAYVSKGIAKHEDRANEDNAYEIAKDLETIENPKGTTQS